MTTMASWLSSLHTAIKCLPYDKRDPKELDDCEDGNAGAHVKARTRVLRRNSSFGSVLMSLVFSAAIVEKYFVSAVLTMTRLSQLFPSPCLPSADHIERTRFAVSAARAHLRCLAIPGGDQAIAIGELEEISSPME